MEEDCSDALEEEPKKGAECFEAPEEEQKKEAYCSDALEEEPKKEAECSDALEEEPKKEADSTTSYYRAGTKTVSASLWWDHFVALCDDLDRATTSPSAAISDALVSPPYPFPQSPHPVLLTLQALAALTNSLAPARAAGGADQGPPRVAPRAVSMFGKPNGASRAVLDAGQVAVGEHRLAVKPDHKEAALHASKSLDLDEVQTCSRTSW
ncbi:hypothetical protein D1007_07588 [Hordeum vulgare]|nr:hypothetical protein D1007_07588 [Hordeum vulgare]